MLRMVKKQFHAIVPFCGGTRNTIRSFKRKMLSFSNSLFVLLHLVAKHITNMHIFILYNHNHRNIYAYYNTLCQKRIFSDLCKANIFYLKTLHKIHNHVRKPTFLKALGINYCIFYSLLRATKCTSKRGLREKKSGRSLWSCIQSLITVEIIKRRKINLCSFFTVSLWNEFKKWLTLMGTRMEKNISLPFCGGTRNTIPGWITRSFERKMQSFCNSLFVLLHLVAKHITNMHIFILYNHNHRNIYAYYNTLW